MKSHKYRMTYGEMTAHPEGLSAEEVKASGRGACDALFLASLIFPEDGSLSLEFASLDGRTGNELSDLEWFKIWALLTSRLAKSHTLDRGRLEFAKLTWDFLQKEMLRK